MEIIYRTTEAFVCSIAFAFPNVNIISYVFTKYCIFVKGEQIMYEIFEKLLKAKGISAYKFCKDTGIPQSTISTWKAKRNIISGDIAKVIAEYFGVSVDYLLTGKEEKHYYLNEETAKIAQEVFENKELRILFDASRNAKPEDILLAAEMLRRLKEKENINE